MNLARENRMTMRKVITLLFITVDANFVQGRKISINWRYKLTHSGDSVWGITLNIIKTTNCKCT